MAAYNPFSSDVILAATSADSTTASSGSGGGAGGGMCVWDAVTGSLLSTFTASHVQPGGLAVVGADHVVTAHGVAGGGKSESKGGHINFWTWRKVGGENRRAVAWWQAACCLSLVLLRLLYTRV